MRWWVVVLYARGMVDDCKEQSDGAWAMAGSCTAALRGPGLYPDPLLLSRSLLDFPLSQPAAPRLVILARHVTGNDIYTAASIMSSLDCGIIYSSLTEHMPAFQLRDLRLGPAREHPYLGRPNAT